MNFLSTMLSRRLATSSLSQQPWLCASCRRFVAAAPPRPATPRHAVARGRFSSSQPEGPRQTQTVGPEHVNGQGQGPQARPRARRLPTPDELKAYHRQKNYTVMNYVISVILLTTALSYGSVPLYKMICQTTGWGGQPVRAHSGSGSDPNADPAERLTPVVGAKRIRVQFHGCVSDVLPWKFVPQQREVRVLPGETALAFYTATNKSDSDIIGVATYSVTPAQVAPYFSKIQCFCFEEQRLAAGESVDMPVFFYLDPDMLKDVNMKGIDTVTLNYTFFKARYDNNGKFSSPLSGK